MQSPKVTVIVPVYNTESFLPTCAKSLMAQTLKELEIIFVDDGSTDSSGTQCDKYAEQDSRVRVIHKTNGGVASARQAGLDEATGEYVIWADSDDWVDLDMYEKMYQKAKERNADLVVCGYRKEFSDGTGKSFSDYFSDSKKQSIVNFLNTKIGNSLFNKLFRRSLILQYNISFVPGINMGEDMLFFFKYLYYAVENVTTEEAYYYHYRQNENSLTHLMSRSSIDEDDQTLLVLKTVLHDTEYAGDLQRYLVNHHVLKTVSFIEKGDVASTKYVIRNVSFFKIMPYLFHSNIRLDYLVFFICATLRMYQLAIFLVKIKRSIKKRGSNKKTEI